MRIDDNVRLYDFDDMIFMVARTIEKNVAPRMNWKRSNHNIGR